MSGPLKEAVRGRRFATDDAYLASITTEKLSSQLESEGM